MKRRVLLARAPHLQSVESKVTLSIDIQLVGGRENEHKRSEKKFQRPGKHYSCPYFTAENSVTWVP